MKINQLLRSSVYLSQLKNTGEGEAARERRETTTGSNTTQRTKDNENLVWARPPPRGQEAGGVHLTEASHETGQGGSDEGRRRAMRALKSGKRASGDEGEGWDNSQFAQGRSQWRLLLLLLLLLLPIET
jgi:hypothetical protein